MLRTSHTHTEHMFKIHKHTRMIWGYFMFCHRDKKNWHIPTSWPYEQIPSSFHTSLWSLLRCTLCSMEFMKNLPALVKGKERLLWFVCSDVSFSLFHFHYLSLVSGLCCVLCCAAAAAAAAVAAGDGESRWFRWNKKAKSFQCLSPSVNLSWMCLKLFPPFSLSDVW